MVVAGSADLVTLADVTFRDTGRLTVKLVGKHSKLHKLRERELKPAT
jgi:hypothetical protein